ncbi:MAG TPA: LPS export ABC transporter periplasmic protein LptC [Terriglobales bacterium]|nr:LPS export ABC transporter periplasmic protein LptC [Terriglobales bacterium]
MPSSISRLRIWFGISALLMIGVVAGFYLYARYRVQRAVHDLPAKLGANIQQNTQGFTYSQSAGGHTIFSISASNAVRYKEGGKAELHNVKIVSYGRNSDRQDEITGDDFEYDAQTGDVTAKGKVGIQLQAVEPGTSKPEASVNKTGSPLHLDTSGLVFNQKTGVAHTAELITFQLPQGTGSAVGATYDSKKGTFKLYSDVHLLTGGPRRTDLRASTAYYEQETQQLTLTDLRAESGIRRLEAQHVILHLREDNTVSRADASGGVDAHVKGERSAQLHSANASFIFGPNNQATTGHLTGGVNWLTQGASASHGNAGEVLLSFGPDNQIKSAHLRNHVDLVQTAQNGNAAAPGATAKDPVTPVGSEGRGTEFHGDGLDLELARGSRLTTATSVGAGVLVLTNAETTPQANAKPTTAKTTITSSRFEAKFAGDNRISSLSGANPVKIISSSPGKPDRISQSRDMVAAFASGKTQTLERVVQSGDVQIQEGQRSATADRATYSQPTDTMALSGNVHYKDASTGSMLTSDSLTLSRATAETTATGNVKTTYSEQKTGQNTPQKQEASGAMLTPVQPVHITAEQMVARNSTGAARFSGAARLWQGGNIVQAPEIDFNRKERTLDAQAQGNARVSTVFVQADQSGKQVPVDVLADHLHYDDTQRKAIFDGAIVLKSGDSTLQAGRAVVTLRAQNQPPPTPKAQAGKAPSQVQSIDATGNILLQQPGRRAVGNRLIYTADEEKFVLTGTPASPPSIFDAEHGQVTGVSLTFFNRDDRVLVDSSNSMSITQTRREK